MKLRILLLVSTLAVLGHGQARPWAGSATVKGPVFATTFTPDGKTAYFCLEDEQRKTTAIMEIHRTATGWSEPKQVSFSGGDWRDIDPFITPDGKRMFFNSNRAVPSGQSNMGFEIWVADRDGDGWSAPRHLPELGSPAFDYFAVSTRKGVLYFISTREGGRGFADVYRAEPSGKGYAAPQPVAEVNTADWDSNVWVSPDERTMILVRFPDKGDASLYWSERVRGKWSAPVSLGRLVSEGDDEFAPGVSPDGKTFYFTYRAKGAERSQQKIYEMPFSELRARAKTAAR